MDSHTHQQILGGFSSGSSPRCFRLQHCQLIQYKRLCNDSQSCTDQTLKKVYDVTNLYIMVSDFPNAFQFTSDHESKKRIISFDKANKEKNFLYNDVKNLEHLLFTAFLRILSASCKLDKDDKRTERPIPSNIGFALYYLLQKLYKHTQLCKTPNIFTDNNYSENKKVYKELYYKLIVNCNEYMDLNQNYENIHLLSNTLLYTLYNMPTSLFVDSFCQELGNKINDMITAGRSKLTSYDPEFQKHLATLKKEEVDYILLNINNCESIKTLLLNKYVSQLVEYEKTNGFNLLNNYAFLAILFLMLHNISQKKYEKIHQLAVQFSKVLQSKQLVAKKWRNSLSVRHVAQNGDDAMQRDEENFVKVIEVLIGCADKIFPNLESVGWGLSTLVKAQSQEVCITFEQQYTIQ